MKIKTKIKIGLGVVSFFVLPFVEWPAMHWWFLKVTELTEQWGWTDFGTTMLLFMSAIFIGVAILIWTFND